MTPVKKHKLFSELPHQSLVWGHEARALAEVAYHRRDTNLPAQEAGLHDTQPHGYWWLYQGTEVEFLFLSTIQPVCICQVW